VSDAIRLIVGEDGPTRLAVGEADPVARREIAELQEDVDGIEQQLEDAAHTDGYLPALTSGAALSLTSPTATESTWAHRVTDAVDGVAMVDGILGNTVVQDGSLLSVQMEGIESADANGNMLTERTIPAATYFPNGMRSAGTVHDELTSDAAITRVGNITIGADDVTLVEVIAEPNANGIYSATYQLPDQYSFSSYVSYNNYVTIGLCNYDVAEQTVFANAKKSGVAINKQNKRLYVRKTSAFTDASVMAELTANPIQIDAILITPTTMPIDPPLTMTYRVEQGGTEAVMHTDPTAAPTWRIRYPFDLAGTVMANIAPVEQPVATATHAIGDLLCVGWQLYRATRAIAIGERIAAGTNVTATTVAAEIAAIQ